MAIPFNLPSYEETENNYQAMNELLAQLYRVFRQILLRQHQPVPNIDNARHGRDDSHQQRRRHHRHSHPQQPEEVEAPTPVSSSPLAGTTMPDVIPRLQSAASVRQCVAPTTATTTTTSAPSHTRPAPRRHQPRPEEEPPHKVEVRDNWTQVGNDLRLYADEFAADKELNLMSYQGASSHKDSSTVLALVPRSFGSRVCVAAVILLFGWRVLQKAR